MSDPEDRLELALANKENIDPYDELDDLLSPIERSELKSFQHLDKSEDKVSTMPLGGK